MPMPDCQVVSLWDRRKGILPFGTGRLEMFWAGSPRARRNPALIIVPGGGYAVVSPQESMPIALRLSEAGFHVGVLYYRLAPCPFPAAFADIARAVRLLRKNADDFAIDAARIGVVGFSAGAHLAGLVAFAPDLQRDADDDLAGSISARPDRLALIYPLVRLTAPTHEESVRNFFGDPQPDVPTRHRFSLTCLVQPNSPPFHLTHAADDDVVPLSASLELLQHARRQGVRADGNIMPRGGHGFGLGGHVLGMKWPGPLFAWLDAL